MAMATTDAPDYLMLLNPDTRVHDGAVEALARYMDTHPGVGIAGSALESPDGQVQLAHHRFPHPLGELLRGARLGMLDRLLPAYLDPSPRAAWPVACDWVSGASMIVRRQVFQDVGVLDDGYFLYFEEVDFCFRARRAGWEIHHVPEARVVHLEGESTGIHKTCSRRKPYWYESRRRFFLKSYGLRGLVAADLLWLIGRASLGLRRLLRLGGNTRNDPRWFALDLLVGDLGAILSGRLPARTVEGKP
jgi:GT2 family glycosyltransferase